MTYSPDPSLPELGTAYEEDLAERCRAEAEARHEARKREHPGIYAQTKAELGREPLPLELAGAIGEARGPLRGVDPGPACTVDTIETPQGEPVLRLRFDSLEALEEYYVAWLIRSPASADSKAETIGTTLLIWDH